MFQSPKLNEKGFTLLEVLMTLLIFSIFTVQIFSIIDMNYKTVKNETANNLTRQELKIVTSYLFDDLMYATYIQVDHQNTFDTLQYETKQGRHYIYKFTYDNGLYEIRNGTEEKIINGSRFDLTLPAVRTENGMVVFNFYADKVNILLDRAVQPRKAVLK